MKPVYLLDTNIIIYFLRDSESTVIRKIQAISPEELAVCSIVKAELFYGAAKSNNPVKSRKIQEAFLSHLVSFSFDDQAVDFYAQIRSNLEKKGAPIGGNDLMIASIALANNLILVTANTREFSKVNELIIENWTVPI